MNRRALGFTPKALQEYMHWQETDKKITRKINRLLIETSSTPFPGTGKPEPLKENYSGYWSRRINNEHRLVYEVNERQILVVQRYFHYKR